MRAAPGGQIGHADRLQGLEKEGIAVGGRLAQARDLRRVEDLLAQGDEGDRQR